MKVKYWAGNRTVTLNIEKEEAEAYAKSGCKKCYGRGLLNYSTPSKKWRQLCTCVEKHLEKQDDVG